MAILIENYESLQPPSGEPGLRFAVIPIGPAGAHRIGKDASGSAAFLIATGRPLGVSPPSLALEHLAVQYDAECRISLATGWQTGTFTLIRCLTTDLGIRRYFLRVAQAMASELGNSPDRGAVAQAVDRLVRLFQAMASTPRNTVQGLWAELFLIARASDAAAERLVSAWHALTGDRYDFSEGSVRMEVKSSSTRTRVHRFALEQLMPVAGTRVIVASVFVERSGAGTSIEDLGQEVRISLRSRPDLAARLDEMVIATLGTAWEHASQDRFDRELAEQSLRFYEANEVPRVAQPPVEVSEVHFDSDLSSIPSLGISGEQRSAGLLQAFIGH